MKKKILIIVGLLILVVVGVGIYFLINYFGDIKKPGKCLVLDNGNCKLLKVESRFTWKILTAEIEKTNVFSPVSGKCTDGITTMGKKNDRQALWIDTNKDGKNYRYQISFGSGNVRCNGEKIEKGTVLKKIEAKNDVEIIISSWLENGDFKDSVLEENLQKSLLTK